jgi:hypothetical protein
MERRMTMKSLSKFAVASGLTTVAVAAFMLMPIASADGTGQIEGGTGVYEVKNLTENTAYGQSTSAKACEELEYSIRLHNSGYVAVNNINVAATLSSTAGTSNTSTMTATYTDGVVPSTTATATVNLSSAQSISYENGTTNLYDGNGNLVKTLNDGVTTSGVSLGSLNGSTTEYVNFKAKVNCPTPPVTPPTTPTTPTTTTTTPAAPTTLVNTGPGSVAAIFVAAVLAGSLGYRAYLSRRLARQ